MKHKKDKVTDKLPWELAWGLRKYPARLDEAKDMTPEDVVFCLLMWFGLSQVDAYIIAYRQEQAEIQLRQWRVVKQKSNGQMNI